MGARRRLRVVLDGKNRILSVLDAFDGPVVEVKVGDLKRLRTWNTARFAPDCESVVLRRDKYLSRIEIAHGMIAAPMSVRELLRLSAQRETEYLLADADAGRRQRPAG